MCPDNSSGGIKTVREQQQVEAPTSNLLLPVQYVGVLTKGSATPSILNCVRWKAMNTAPVNIVDFKNGQPGQEIKVLGDGFTTVNNNTKIKNNTGANKLLAVNKVYTWTKFDTWVENA